MSVDNWIEQNRGRPAPPGSVYGRTPPSAPRYDPARSRTMAGWALGLSLAFCIPFAFLIAIGLAITVLVRSAGGGVDHGKGRAIAALVISGLIIIANIIYAVVIVFSGVDNTERDSKGRVVEGGSVSIERLRVGDCFNEPNFEDLLDGDAEGQASAAVDVVPCREPHQAEVYDIITVSGDDFPGDAAIERRTAECLHSFKEYVGKSYGRSRLDAAIYYPTQSSWRFGDRTILCNLTERDLSDLEGSKRNSRQ